MYLHLYKVGIACVTLHVCVCDAGVYMLAQLFSLRDRKLVVLGGDKYTGGTLSAATQTQAGSIPAVKRGLYLCMCVTLCLNQGK